jgi:hypothetical protein
LTFVKTNSLQMSLGDGCFTSQLCCNKMTNQLKI